jgi:K+-sensing histidine kinase KdpD
VRANIKIAVGIAICSSAARVFALFLDESRETRLAAPPMCLLVVIVTTIYLGRLAGILGAVAASCVLAVYLYSPLGTLYVQEHAARTMLNLFLIAAVAVACLVPSPPERDTAEKSHARSAAPRGTLHRP